MYTDQRLPRATANALELDEQSPENRATRTKLKVLRSESGGFPIWADYTPVAAKVMTIQERRRMLTGGNLGKRTAE